MSRKIEDIEYAYDIDNEIFNILNQYETELNQYTSAMFYEGLDRVDYGDITTILIELNKIRGSLNNEMFTHRNVDLNIFFIKKIETLLNDFYKIRKSIEQNIINNTLKEKVFDVGSLLHLVFTNNEHNKIKLYSDASVMFSCQFHIEKTPSFGVTDGVGLCLCFGCGSSFNMIDYIRNYENLTYHEAVQLLSRIYMINIANNMIDESHPQVIKYRNTLLSNEFKELLTKLNDRVTRREEKTGITKSTYIAKEKIKSNFETIERVRRGEYKDFVKNKQKRLILEMPSFN